MTTETEDLVIPEMDLSPLGRRVIQPGVVYFHRRAGVDTVAGSICAVAAVAAGEALDAVLSQPLPGPDGVDRNPFTRRAAELNPTLMLRAVRPASAHFVIALIEDRDDRRLVSKLMHLAPEESVPRLLAVHSDTFELGRESQRAVADLWSRASDQKRYSVGLWGLVTAGAFGVRHLHDEAARAFRFRLDDRLAQFGRRLAGQLRDLSAPQADGAVSV